MTEIQLLVADQLLTVSVKPVIATGAKNTVKATFDFESGFWSSCGKQAVFWNSKTPNEVISVPLDVNNSCTVPACVLTKEGYFYIGVIGFASDGESKKTSTVIKYQLKKGAPDGTGEVVAEPPDIWEQCLAIMGDTVSASQEAIRTASGAVGTANEAVDIANSAVETAERAVEKLNICYVDEEGILHIYACENIKQIAPTIDVAANNGKVYVNVTNVDGTMKAVQIPSGEDGKDGSSATIQVEEIEGGYRLTIRDISGVHSVEIMHGKDGAGGAERLAGSTSDVTPMNVMSAIAEGKTLLINHTDNTYGIVMFANFAVAAGMDIVAGSATFEFSGILFNANLVGDLETNTWNFAVNQLATDKTATAVDLSGFDNGVIVETYADGSTLTHNLTFDSEGKVTKITDSNGKETVVTW